MNKTKLIFYLVAFFCLCFQQSARAQGGTTAFEEKIALLGFKSDDLVDQSDKKKIAVSMPTCAYINITGIDELPPQKTSKYHAWLEFYDGCGNYFKKKVIISVQGNSTTKWPKKNYSLDFCEDDWVGDKTTDITIGNWVTQDSYHIKAYYLDYFRGVSPVAYKTYDIIASTRGEKIWERANLSKPDANALCHPDAFPVIMYFNGDFYGVYAWQLKKNRNNMNQKKSDPAHIHLDGGLRAATIFSSGIDWTLWEVRNPKSLYTMDGKAYNGDYPKELMDETSPYYDLESDAEDVRIDKQNTALVKHRIEQLNKHWSEMQAIIESGASDEEIRAELSQRFDVPGVIDYIIHDLMVVNLDGLERNWQWFTYDGYKWFVAPYDLDATFGYQPSVFIIFKPQYYALSPIANHTWKNYKNPLTLIQKYFADDINEQYALMRDTGILTAESVTSLFDNWYFSIGEDNWQQEWNVWSNSPCLKEDIANTNWKQIDFNFTAYYKCKEYNATQVYKKGDRCRYKFRIWEATAETQGQIPYLQIGSFDNLDRIHEWVPIHLEYLDKAMKYTATPMLTSYSLQISAVGWATLCVPFKFAIPEGLEVYTVIDRAKDIDKMGLELVEETEPNKPYLVKGAQGMYELIGYRDEGSSSDPDYLINGLLRGSYITQYVPSGDYVLQNHNGRPGFYRVGQDNQITVGPNRAYLTLNKGSEAPEALFLDEQVTGIDTYTSAPTVIGAYDLNGREHSELQRGINIVRYSDGSTIKVIVK